MENEAHKECVEDKDVTSDVVNDDGERNMAHKDCAKNVRVAYDVTSVDENEIEIEAHKDCAESECVISDVTSVDEGENANNAHKRSARENKTVKGNDTGDDATVDEDKKSQTPNIIPPKRLPNKTEERKMLGKVIQIMALVGMENHVYKFGNIIRNQKSGGPIGLALTGDIADCYLIEWDKKFIQKTKLLGIDLLLYKRYRDDIFIVAEVIEKGSKYEEGNVIVDMVKKETDSNRKDEDITMEVVVDIAESLDGIIKFTYEIPDSKSGKLAVLDVTVNVNKAKNNRMDHEFFEKPTKNKRVILKDAALPANQKRTILTQECLRRLRNTKLELGEDIKVKHLNEFILKLKNSGYPTKYRTEILESALVAYDKMVEADKDETKPLFRDRNWNREQRNDEKINRKVNWYKSGGNGIENKSILFVPVTKGGTLAKELKKREEEINKNSKERIKIVEGGGTKMKDILVVKNPFPSTTCEKKKCLLCSNISNKVKIPCNSNNVGYRLVCETCQDRGIEKVYKGETARSARIRGAEHLSNFRCGREDSPLFKHKQNDHKDGGMKFRMEITSSQDI